MQASPPADTHIPQCRHLGAGKLNRRFARTASRTCRYLSLSADSTTRTRALEPSSANGKRATMRSNSSFSVAHAECCAGKSACKVGEHMVIGCGAETSSGTPQRANACNDLTHREEINGGAWHGMPRCQCAWLAGGALTHASMQARCTKHLARITET